MRLQQVYRGSEAHRFALEPGPYGADWPEVAYEAEVILVYKKEPRELGAHFYLLLAYDADKNEVGWKRIAGWGDRQLATEDRFSAKLEGRCPSETRIGWERRELCDCSPMT